MQQLMYTNHIANLKVQAKIFRELTASRFGEFVLEHDPNVLVPNNVFGFTAPALPVTIADTVQAIGSAMRKTFAKLLSVFPKKKGDRQVVNDIDDDPDTTTLLRSDPGLATQLDTTAVPLIDAAEKLTTSDAARTPAVSQADLLTQFTKAVTDADDALRVALTQLTSTCSIVALEKEAFPLVLKGLWLIRTPFTHEEVQRQIAESERVLPPGSELRMLLFRPNWALNMIMVAYFGRLGSEAKYVFAFASAICFCTLYVAF